jgi:hypothetical protein
MAPVNPQHPSQSQKLETWSNTLCGSGELTKIGEKDDCGEHGELGNGQHVHRPNHEHENRDFEEEHA